MEFYIKERCHCDIFSLWKNRVSISESGLMLGVLVILAKKNSAWWKIYPRVEDSLFYVIGR
jgi:hypothetical protein